VTAAVERAIARLGVEPDLAPHVHEALCLIPRLRKRMPTMPDAPAEDVVAERVARAALETVRAGVRILPPRGRR